MSSVNSQPVQATHVLRPYDHDRHIDLITTTTGGYDVAVAAYRAGVLVGYEATYNRPPISIPVEFVDWPFTREGRDFEDLREDHLSTVYAEEPRYAVAPDVMDGFTLDDAIEYGEILKERAETVIIVPKDVHPSEVPARFRVGMPCQKRFGETQWDAEDFATCNEVHLLGGSPNVHKDVMGVLDNVYSIDSATPVKSARFGDYWGDGGWNDSELGFTRALEKSLENIGYELNPETWHRFSHRKAKFTPPEFTPGSGEYQQGGYPDETLINLAKDDIPFPGRKYYSRK